MSTQSICFKWLLQAYQSYDFHSTIYTQPSIIYYLLMRIETYETAREIGPLESILNLDYYSIEYRIILLIKVIALVKAQVHE